MQAAWAPNAGEFAARFALEAECGRGGAAVIYSAVDRHSGQRVALKLLHDPQPLQAARFREEAAALCELHHPAIVAHVAHGETETGALYLAMEWLEGETLEQRLVREGALALEDVLHLGQRLCLGLAAAHARGIVHRDIKPANIFLVGGATAQAKIIDLGIARRLFGGRRMTQAGSTLGTPMYMAPEQARGEADLDARADLFALGCVLLEAATGQPPFVAETPSAVLERICATDSVKEMLANARLPRRFTALLQRLLETDRARRASDAAALAAELGRLATGPSDSAERPRARTPVRYEGAAPPATVASLLLVALPPGLPSGEAEAEAAGRLRQALAPFGARIERLPDARRLALVAEPALTPPQAAALGAEAAAAAVDALPGASVAVVTARAEPGGSGALGGWLQSAARLQAEAAGAAGAFVDAATAALVETRFEIETSPTGPRQLLYARLPPEAVPPLGGAAQPPPCVGRDRELSTLVTAWRDCVSEGAAGAFWVSAPAGAGKSCVRRAFVCYVQDEGGPLAVYLAGGQPAELALASALRQAAGVRDPAVDRAVASPALRRFTARRVPAAQADFLAEALLATLAPAAHPARVRDGWLALWAAELARGPVLVLVEDAHLVSAAEWEILTDARRTFADRPFFLVGFARSDSPPLEEAAKSAGFALLALPPLSSKSMQVLARLALGSMTEERAAWVVEHAQGNPARLDAILRGERADRAHRPVEEPA